MSDSVPIQKGESGEGQAAGSAAPEPLEAPAGGPQAEVSSVEADSLPAPAGGEPPEAALPEPVESGVESESVTPPESGPPTGAARPPAPQARPRSGPAYLTWSQALWLVAGSNLLTLALAVIFILIFLSALNGGLRYARPAQLFAAQARLEALDRQAGDLQAGLDETNTLLTELQDLGPRIRIVQEEADTLRQAMRETAGRVDGFQANMDELSLQVDALLARVGRFQKFIEGLELLLAGLKEVEAP